MNKLHELITNPLKLFPFFFICSKDTAAYFTQIPLRWIDAMPPDLTESFWNLTWSSFSYFNLTYSLNGRHRTSYFYCWQYNYIWIYLTQSNNFETLLRNLDDDVLYNLWVFSTVKDPMRKDIPEGACNKGIRSPWIDEGQTVDVVFTISNTVFDKVL